MGQEACCLAFKMIFNNAHGSSLLAPLAMSRKYS